MYNNEKLEQGIRDSISFSSLLSFCFLVLLLTEDVAMAGTNKDDPVLTGDNSGGGVISTLLLSRESLLEGGGDSDSLGLVLVLVSGLLSNEVNLVADTLLPSLPYTFLATLSANGISSSLSLEI